MLLGLGAHGGDGSGRAREGATLHHVATQQKDQDVPDPDPSAGTTGPDLGPVARVGVAQVGPGPPSSSASGLPHKSSLAGCAMGVSSPSSCLRSNIE